MTVTWDICSIGHIPCDIIGPVDDPFLTQNGLIKGQSNLISFEFLEKLREPMAHAVRAPGGSAANMACGTASLGIKTVFMTRLADDEVGRYLMDDFTHYGIRNAGPFEHSDAGSDQLLALITPDGERTFAAYYGVVNEMTPEDVDAQILQSAHYLHIEGYMLKSRRGFDILDHAGQIVRGHGGMISFSPSDLSVMNAYADEVRHLAQMSDILILDEHQARLLMKEDDIQTIVNSFSKTGAITQGSHGAYVFKDGQHAHIPAAPLTRPVVNTNGAGDQFAAGLLAGFIKGLDLTQAGRLAALCGADAVVYDSPRPMSDYTRFLSQV
jgi:sugar/nucleoside kinase (ribokinase family)